MLIHKATLGVLEFAPWDGSYRTFNGVCIPILRPATLAGLGLDPADWWEVDGRSSLAKALRGCWPWFDPVVIAGELVDIQPWPAWRVYGEAEPVHPPERKHRRRRRVGLKLG